MKTKLPVVLSFLLCMIGFAQPKLFTVDSNRSYYQIDMVTAARTLIGTIDASVGTPSGLAYDRINDVLYLSSSGNDALYIVNRTTLAATLVGAYGDTAIVMHGLEYHEPSGKLYGMSSHNAGLYEINKITGAATLIGISGLTSFCNLGWDSTNNIMFMTNSGTDSFYSVNLTNGSATLIGPLLGPTNPNGLAYNHTTDTLYLIDNSTDNLYTINRTTGATTTIGNAGSGNYLGLVYINETLAANAFQSASVSVFAQNGQLVLECQPEALRSAEIYDMAGRVVYQNTAINNNRLELPSAQFGKQLLIVKGQTQNGTPFTKKIAN